MIVSFLTTSIVSLSSMFSMTQSTVKEVIQGFERSTHLVNSLGLFSRNEQFEDVPTSSLRWAQSRAENGVPRALSNAIQNTIF